jgi:hypothetical protein
VLRRIAASEHVANARQQDVQVLGRKWPQPNQRSIQIDDIAFRKSVWCESGGERLVATQATPLVLQAFIRSRKEDLKPFNLSLQAIVGDAQDRFVVGIAGPRTR